jgi:Cu2+-exporting ATPase
MDTQRYYLGQPDYACAAAGIATPEQPSPGHWVLLADEQQAVAWFLLNDETRDDAASLVSALQQQGITVHMLSGDSSGSAEQLSQQLGISHCRSSATPEQKLQYIAQLQQQGAKVLMIGDGINDIPVLAAADASVAMTNASDLAKTHADGILLSGQLSGITEMMALSLRTKRTIKQNLAWSLLYNFSAIPLAAQGLIPPYLAAIGMSLSSLLVLVNALRLQRWRLKTTQQRSH